VVIVITYAELYTEYKDYLVAVAYRMLGSVADAEDVVHDLFLNISSRDWSQVANVRSYLVKSTINRCMNVLQSSIRRRERYIGPWLPEPFVEHIDELTDRMIERKEDIRYALVVLLHRLSPQERAAYLLKDILGFTYQEVAGMLERTDSNCRKILSRARAKLSDISPVTVAHNQEIDDLVSLFIHATRTGRYTSLVDHLLKDVVLITDGGGKTKAAMKPIYGADRVMAFLQGVHSKGAYDGEMTRINLNGEPGIRLSRNGRIILTISFQLAASKHISHIYIVMNPEKLLKV